MLGKPGPLALALGSAPPQNRADVRNGSEVRELAGVRGSADRLDDAVG